MTYSAIDVLEELEREIKMRRSVYPRWVEQGKLKEAAMARRIDILEHVASEWRERAKSERLL